MFDDFQTFDASLDRATPGTGLGLGIARQLASELGGAVSVVSQLGQGTTISLHLPHQDISGAQEQAFVLCIGEDNLPEIGAWADIVSSWVWQFAHADTVEAAKQLIGLLGQVPDIIVLNLPKGQKPSSEDITVLEQIAPVVHLLPKAAPFPPPATKNSIALPIGEYDLRQALERLLQNNASSRAR